MLCLTNSPKPEYIQLTLEKRKSAHLIAGSCKGSAFSALLNYQNTCWLIFFRCTNLIIKWLLQRFQKKLNFRRKTCLCPVDGADVMTSQKRIAATASVGKHWNFPSSILTQLLQVAALHILLQALSYVANKMIISCTVNWGSEHGFDEHVNIWHQFSSNTGSTLQIFLPRLWWYSIDMNVVVVILKADPLWDETLAVILAGRFRIKVKGSQFMMTLMVHLGVNITASTQPWHYFKPLIAFYFVVSMTSDLHQVRGQQMMIGMIRIFIFSN